MRNSRIRFCTFALLSFLCLSSKPMDKLTVEKEKYNAVIVDNEIISSQVSDLISSINGLQEDTVSYVDGSITFNKDIIFDTSNEDNLLSIFNISFPVIIDLNGHSISAKVPGVTETGVVNSSASKFSLFRFEKIQETKSIENYYEISDYHYVIKNGTIIGGSKSAILYDDSLFLENVNIKQCGSIDCFGGAICDSSTNANSYTFLSLINCQLNRNVAKYGGAIFSANPIMIEKCSFVENRSIFEGGGGGAIEAQNTLYIMNSTFANNQSTEVGGAVNLYKGTAYVLNSTFTGNLTTNSSGGGGAFGVNDGSLYTSNCVFAFNYRYDSTVGTYVHHDIDNYAMLDNVDSNIFVDGCVYEDLGCYDMANGGKALFDYSACECPNKEIHKMLANLGISISDFFTYIEQNPDCTPSEVLNNFSVEESDTNTLTMDYIIQSTDSMNKNCPLDKCNYPIGRYISNDSQKLTTKEANELFCGLCTSLVYNADGTLYGNLNVQITRPIVKEVNGMKQVFMNTQNESIDSKRKCYISNNLHNIFACDNQGAYKIFKGQLSFTQTHNIQNYQDGSERNGYYCGASSTADYSLNLITLIQPANCTVIGSSSYGNAFFENESITLEAIPDTDYKFIKWIDYTTNETLSYDELYSFKSTKNLVISAVFSTNELSMEIRYDIGYDNASISKQKQSIIGDDFLTSNNTLYREGYYFKGWTKDATVENPVIDYHDCDEITFVANTTLELTALWEKEKYEIHFDSNGGSSVTDLNNLYIGDSLSLPKPTKTDYVFNGWYEDIDGNENLFSDNVVGDYGGHNTIRVLKARWSLETRKFSYFANTSDDNPFSVVDYGIHTNATDITYPEKTGYDFKGWFTDKGLTNQWNFEEDTVEQDTSLYAKFEKKQYAISLYQSIDASTSYDCISALYNTTLSNPVVADKPGYHVDGWYTDKNFTHRWVFGDDGTMVDSDVSLYPKWVINSYTVSYYLGNEDDSTLYLTNNVNYNATVGSPNNPTKKGYSFEGWYLDKEFTDPFIFGQDGTKVLNDIKLYAKFDKVDNLLWLWILLGCLLLGVIIAISCIMMKEKGVEFKNYDEKFKALSKDRQKDITDVIALFTASKLVLEKKKNGIVFKRNDKKVAFINISHNITNLFLSVNYDELDKEKYLGIEEHHFVSYLEFPVRVKINKENMKVIKDLMLLV